MDIHHLVGMANRIGDFFQSMPDRSQAKVDIAQHLSHFWAPRMREALIAHVNEASSSASTSESTSDLHEIVREAVNENLALLATKHAVNKA